MDRTPIDRTAARLRAIGHLAAALVAATGAAVLAGWWLDVPVLRQPLAGLPSMAPNTALLFVVAGAGLELAVRPGSPHWLRLACAAAVGAGGGVTLLEHLCRLPFGIDDLLAQGPGNPGLGLRPSPNTALAFLLLGGSLAAREGGPRARRTADGLALVVILMSLLVLAAHTFGATELYEALPDAPEPTGMAVHTAAAFLLVCGGLLCVPPSEAARLLASPYAGGVVARRIVAGALAMPALGLLVVLGHWAGWYGHPIGAAILAVAGVAVAGGLIAPMVTALDRSDEAVRTSEERLRALVDQASDGIFLADLEGRYTDVNEAGCRMLGYPRQELVGKTIADLLPDQELERFAGHRSAILDGAVEVSEWRLRRRDGGYLPVEVSAKLLHDGRWQAFVRDVSERKAAEAALREAAAIERRLRAQLEAVTEASVAVSEAVTALPASGIETVLRTVAAQAQRLTGAEYVAVGLGVDPAQPFAPWVALGIEPGDAGPRPPRPVGILGAVARDGEELRLDDLRAHPACHGLPAGHPELAAFLGVPVRHGQRIVGNLFLARPPGGAPFTASDESVVRMLAARAGLAIETAHLYQNEAAQRSWLQHVIDQMPDGVLVYDGEGRVLHRNTAARELAGGGDAEPDLVSTGGQPLVPEERPARRAVLGRESVGGVALAVPGEHGGLTPVLVSATPTWPGGAVVVLRDIRAYKELEQLREEWASVIAHDLRQPVSSILLNLDVAERQGAAEQRPTLERIRSAARRLGRMIGDLSDLSQLEARRLRLQVRRLDLADLVRDATVRLAEHARGHEVSVTASGPLPVSADPDRLEQVLGNLISNAAKYGSAATPIQVDAKREGDAAELTVTNQGRGIPAAELPLLFARFGRARAARESGKPGLGLGLYICKGLVEAQGGSIRAESAPRGPTTFRIRFPLAG